MNTESNRERKTAESLEREINHILESGANHIRLIELFNRYASQQCASLMEELAKAEDVITKAEEFYISAGEQIEELKKEVERLKIDAMWYRSIANRRFRTF